MIATIDVEAQAGMSGAFQEAFAFIVDGSLYFRNLSFEQIDALGRRTKGQDVATCA